MAPFARRLIVVVALLQAMLTARVACRLLATSGGRRIEPLLDTWQADGPPSVSVVLPVLNEAARVAPCLEGLIRQGAETAEILVVDGGSTDQTEAVVAGFCQRDTRVRWIAAGPPPHGWNGKVWGLQHGLQQLDARSGWVLTIDADVRPAPPLIRSLLAHAAAESVPALSVATRQQIEGAGEALLHPSMLTTLVYRFGIPGQVARRVDQVQANGQCALYRRALLDRVGGFAAVKDSICEDVTIARMLVALGEPVGFYEAGDLVTTRMYEGARETWDNWPRSLPLRDRYAGAALWLGLLEVTVAQALPLPLLAVLRWRGPAPRVLIWAVSAALAMRVGVLAGTSRAYVTRPWSYWLSPLCDLPVAVLLWRGAFRRSHTWRGRTIVRGAR